MSRGRSGMCALLALAAGMAGPALAGPKEDHYAEMLLIGEQIDALQAAHSEGAQLEALQARYRALSAGLGGDDPARTARHQRRPSAPARPDATESVPTLPPVGCRSRSLSASNAAPVAISAAGSVVVTSTVTVFGATGTLWDVDVQTFITHTFASDLDITLTSPAGTVVTLTTDNGGDNDNVFDGTVWDDQADPGGQVPYASNDRLVTDRVYANLTTATPLVPEEALGAFNGESPNGTWTLTISDDSNLDGGALNSWTLNLTTIDVPPVSIDTFFDLPAPVAIPGGVAVVTSSATIAAGFNPLTVVGRVRARTNIRHAVTTDLDVTLQAPNGRVVTLTTDNGASEVFNGTIWDDYADPGGQVPYSVNDGLVTDHSYVNQTTATPLVPEESMSALIGTPLAGAWTLTVSDDSAGFGGSIDGVRVFVGASNGCTFKGDLDHDSFVDLVLREVATNQHDIWRMQGTTRTLDTPVSPALGPTQRVVGVDDFNRDGRSDLVIRDASSNLVEFWMMSGATRVGSPVSLTGGAAPPPRWALVATGDFNNDGAADLLWRDSASQKLAIWKLGENAPLTQKTGEIIPSPDQAADANWRVVAALDFNSDNNRDLLWYNDTSGKTVVWFMDASVHRTSGTFTVPSSAGNANWRVVAAGDYGADSSGNLFKNDLVWRNDTSGSIVVWYMDGGNPPTRTSGTFTTPSSPTPGTAWEVVGPK